MRQGKAELARNMLQDVEEKCNSEGSPLKGFQGSVSIDFIEEQEASRRRQRKRSRDSQARGAGRGARRIARGGHRTSRIEWRPPSHFENIASETIVIHMPASCTPPCGDSDAHETLEARSQEFISHTLVEDLGDQIYDPNTSESGHVYLYHGTRSKHLRSFQMRGIDPSFKRNDFSVCEAFYTSNSIRYAYEHSLHYHPLLINTGAVCVLQFELDVEVLHGLQVAPGELTPFTNLWFIDAEEDKPTWQEFCKENLTSTGSRHHYDIVTGPMCLPRDEGDYGKLEIKLSGDAPLTQIAFCSKRARSWLEQCFKRVYVEARGTSQEQICATTFMDIELSH